MAGKSWKELRNERESLRVDAWAALRSGLYLTTVNRYLTAPDAGYIVDDCGAQVLVSSRAVHEVASEIPDRAPGCRRFLVIDGPP